MTIQHLRDLHAETTADAYYVACVEGACDHNDDECPLTEVSICDYCYDHPGDPEQLAEWMMWPCETICALDAPEDVEARP